MQRVLLVVALVSFALAAAPEAAQAQYNPKDYSDAKKAIFSRDPVERTAGLSFLALLGEDAKGSTRDVVGLLFDNNRDVRDWANKALVNVNPPLADPILLLVNGQDYDKRVDAMRKLGTMGVNAAPAIPALLRFLQQAEPNDQAKVVTALATVGAKDPAIPATLANIALSTQNPAVRAAALAELPKTGNPQAAVDVFGNLLKNTDPAQRTNGVAGLGAMAATNANAMALLNLCLKDPSPSVRDAAVKAIAEAEKKKKQMKQNK